MPNPVVKLPSGAELELQEPPFKMATRFYRTVASVARGAEMPMDLTALKEGRDASPMKNLILELVQSDRLEAMIFELLAQGCLYDGKKITEDTFEPTKARGDWLAVAWEVSKHALVPFSPSLGFLFEAFQGAMGAIPR